MLTVQQNKQRKNDLVCAYSFIVCPENRPTMASIRFPLSPQRESDFFPKKGLRWGSFELFNPPPPPTTQNEVADTKPEFLLKRLPAAVCSRLVFTWHCLQPSPNMCVKSSKHPLKSHHGRTFWVRNGRRKLCAVSCESSNVIKLREGGGGWGVHPLRPQVSGWKWTQR